MAVVGGLLAPFGAAAGRSLQSAAVACPAQVEPFPWACSVKHLGPELLDDPTFASPSGGWEMYTKQGAPGATVAYNAPGALLDVQPAVKSEDKYLPWRVQLKQTRNLDVDAASGAWYELCTLVAGGNESSTFQFAVDNPPSFAVAGDGDRMRLGLAPAGELKKSCFRFALQPSSTSFAARVLLELGETSGKVALCQASLRRCSVPRPVEAYPPIRRCHLDPLMPGRCSRVRLFDTQGYPEFAQSEFGQDTDGRLQCLQKAHALRANSFTFKGGAAARCEVYHCFSREALLDSAVGTPGDATVFSEMCEYQESASGKHGGDGYSPVFVKLWEWNYKDVARECKEYLGPNGFQGVQVSPVVEHITGTAWWTRYQPVSFGLNTRSGTRKDFEDMVATCRQEGVEVIVDILLNHMAEPCQEAGGSTATPCTGWQGSKFGNRRMANVTGWDAVGPELFHHKAGQPGENCKVDESTWRCPDNDPPADCTPCDLKKLPDWDTGLPATRDLLFKHLSELYRIGVTMLRIDAASYMSSLDLGSILNRLPWDYVFQEWWDGAPAAERTRSVGHYRDVLYSWKICEALAVKHVDSLPVVLEVTSGVPGIAHERALYPLTFHDRRSADADHKTPTYKNGLEFHQQQKFLLAWPKGGPVRLWGGYGWKGLDDGPPGCEDGPYPTCSPKPVFDSQGRAQCMSTPTESPLPLVNASKAAWVCEHRWAGVAGLIKFRKACRGLPVTQNWVSGSAGTVGRGRLAFRAGQSCFVALTRSYNAQVPTMWPRVGPWSLSTLITGLPPGRYCDVASLTTLKGWDGKSCPREVTLGTDGQVLCGQVEEGDLLAIHVGTRLGDLPGSAQSCASDSRSDGTHVLSAAGRTWAAPGAGRWMLVLLGAVASARTSR